MLLPLLPTGIGDSSPYATRCAFGLNPLFISLSAIPDFVELGGLSSLSGAEQATLAQARASERIRYDLVFPLKWAAFRRAFERFEAKETKAGTPRAQAFSAFVQEQGARWLDSYVLYAVLAHENEQRPWWEWPNALAERRPDALDAARTRLKTEVRFHSWLQWIAHGQWQQVRSQAKEASVLLCGDEPFIIGQDSADAWANPTLLRRDARLGVPPDDFSATGQDWGLPYFDFAAMERDGYAWLRSRAAQSATYYDLRRVDHAVGYFRQYIRDARTPLGRFVPGDEPSQRALGERLLRLMQESSGIVAEDLGVIPPFAREVLGRLQLPGYRVMRWERDPGRYRNPREYPAASLATTGTHDTDTLRQWWESAGDQDRAGVAQVYPELHGMWPPPRHFTKDIHRALLAAAENSSSNLCVLPWQDILGTADRINLPGSQSDANWAYRIDRPTDELIKNDGLRAVAQELAQITRAAGR
jgi:4-alpha-glucanotransferase